MALRKGGVASPAFVVFTLFPATASAGFVPFELESPIAQANPATFAKRTLEQQKKRKAEEKLARRAAKKQSKAGGSNPY